MSAVSKDTTQVDTPAAKSAAGNAEGQSAGHLEQGEDRKRAAVSITSMTMFQTTKLIR
jgi:hypothetical protein